MMEMLIRVVGVDYVMYACEMLGGVNATDPETGRSFDDNMRFIEAIGWLDVDDRRKIFEENARRAYPRLAARLAV
jgi:4-oxalmesaconate hydratase